jgi:signal transduction histidine kinase
MRARPFVGDSILAAVLLALGLTGQPDPRNTGPSGQTPAAYAAVVLCCLVLVWRRTAPLPVWASTVVVGATGIAIAGGPSQTIAPAMVAVYTVATLFRKRAAILCAVGTALTFITTYHWVTGETWFGDATYTLLAVSGMACAIGIAVRGQRQMVVAAEERAVRAEATREEEAQRRVTEERLRIARELHDVVAHHISVINVQSGVAKHLVHSDPDAADAALGHVRDASAVVLSEMATILGLLRTADDAPDTQPAPGLAQADALVESVRRSGLTVSWRVTGSPRALAPSVDLTAYRIVQEALTNAGKHGLGAADVTVDYRDELVVIDVTNPVAVARAGSPAGHGLVGMRERVASVGGTLDAGPRGDGRFHVHAELPLGSADVASAYQRSLA